MAASVPFFLIHEGYSDRMRPGVAHKTWEMDDEGYVSLPQGPGLGVEVDEERAVAVGKDPSLQFRWEGHFLEDGSVADY